MPKRKADRGRSCWPGAADLHQSSEWTGPEMIYSVVNLDGSMVEPF